MSSTAAFSPAALRARREAAGKSRERLAVDIARSYQSIVAYESGAAVPSTRILPAIAASLGCSIGDLFTVEPVDGAA